MVQVNTERLLAKRFFEDWDTTCAPDSIPSLDKHGAVRVRFRDKHCCPITAVHFLRSGEHRLITDDPKLGRKVGLTENESELVVRAADYNLSGERFSDDVFWPIRARLVNPLKERGLV